MNPISPFTVKGIAEKWMHGRKSSQLSKTSLNRTTESCLPYLYGSFARGEAFRGIDVAVHLRDPEQNPFDVSSDLKGRISRSLHGSDFDAFIHAIQAYASTRAV